MFGISYFSAVVNPPQAAILAVGGGVPRVIPPKAAGEKPRTVTTVTVQLSADRRVVDEAIAAQFLQVRIDVQILRCIYVGIFIRCSSFRYARRAHLIYLY
jgi:hypothetical protein